MIGWQDKDAYKIDPDEGMSSYEIAMGEGLKEKYKQQEKDASCRRGQAIQREDEIVTYCGQRYTFEQAKAAYLFFRGWVKGYEPGTDARCEICD